MGSDGDSERDISETEKAAAGRRAVAAVQGRGDMERITGDVMRTIEPSKRRKFLMNLENQEMRIVCKGVPDTAPGYTVVEQDVLHTYIRQAIGQCCVLCDGAGCDMARCELRKALKKTVMFEIDETDGICFGKKLLTHMEG